MLFNSPVFMFVFLPAALAVFLLLRRFRLVRTAQAALVLASFVFYAWWNPKYLLLLLLSIVVNLAMARVIGNLRSGDDADKGRRRAAARSLLLIAITFNLGLLGYFKYANFFLDTLTALGVSGFGHINVLLPLAISFFTFQQVAYQVDTYQGKIQDHDPVRYALFVTFFPQLIAGPIVHHSEMMPQFREEVQHGRDRLSDFQLGLFIFAIGLFKKVLIADTIAQFSSPVYSQALNGAQPDFFAAWLAALGYTVQIYFDFSGYCDMATGAARMFGIKLPANFFSPYKSLSIVEFWRRWHITLSRFLRDYLYIPLGGNRRGRVRRYSNLMTTMLLGGLWHGAGWTFVFWGFLHGAYLVVNHAWTALMVRSGRQEQLAGSGLYRFFCWTVTMLAVIVAWVFFRAESFPAAIAILKGMAGMNGVEISPALATIMARIGADYASLRPYISGSAVAFEDMVSGFLLAAIAIWAAAKWPNVYEMTADRDPLVDAGAWIERPAAVQWSPTVLWAVLTGFLLALAFMSVFSAAPSEFLYFRF